MICSKHALRHAHTVIFVNFLKPSASDGYRQVARDLLALLERLDGQNKSLISWLTPGNGVYWASNSVTRPPHMTKNLCT